MRAIVILLFHVILFSSYSSFSQEATAASDIQTFFLSNDDLGQIENSVNLFTGEVNLPINLINIPGRGGLSAGVSLMYNSNIEEIANIWNLEAPTGILGLGWSMNIPKIVVDNRLTGAREDDLFYLMEGGNSSRLYCVAINGDGTREYKPDKIIKWQIIYDESYERWTIVKEDGMTYIYGDDDINYGSAIEYVIHWDNWIGNSSNYQYGTTKKQGLVWNLSKIRNRWGDAVTFEYKKVERFIKSGTGPRHTEASYLKKITDPLGRTINFLDLPKETREYQDPHTEVTETDNADGTGNATADAYQERYEKRYLAEIEIRDTDNSLVYSFDFVYNVPSDGDMTKRLLTSIVQKNKDGASFPAIDFSYKTSGNKKGALEKVTYPQGGEVTYHYNETGISLGYSDRDEIISAPSGYAEPQIWMGDDFAVIAWREYNGSTHVSSGKKVKLWVYTWEGEWKGHEWVEIPNVEVSGYELKDFKVAMGEDYFGVLKHNSSTQNSVLYLTHKDKGRANGWTTYSDPYISMGTDMPLFFSGNNYVGVGKREDGHLYTYNWNGYTWQEKTLKSSSGGYYHGCGTNNYIIYHDEVGQQGGYADYIYFFYKDEKGEWLEKSVPASYYFWSSDDSYWHPSNSFALAMAHNNNEFIYMWDENYNMTDKFDVLGGYSDEGIVKILNNSMVALPLINSSRAKVARFDGIGWIATNELTSYQNSPLSNYFSFGEDLIFWPDNAQDLQSKRFNPNTQSWVNGFYVNGYNDLEYAGQGNVYYDKDIYLRNSNEVWNSIPIYTLPSGHDPDHAHFNSNGNNLYMYESSNDLYTFWEKNGEVIQGDNTETVPNYSVFRGNSFIRSKDWIKGNTLASFYYTYFQIENADQIKLSKLIKDGISGTIKEYPVTGIEINGGSDSKYINIEYDAASSIYNEKSNGAIYNKVTVTHLDENGSPAAFGSSEYYFFNGLSTSESAEAFPTGGSSLEGYRILTGQVYLKRLLEGSKVVSEEETVWTTFAQSIYNSLNEQVAEVYLTMPTKKEVTVGNIVSTTDYTYDISTGNLKTSTTTNSEGKSVKNYYDYLHEITASTYDFAENDNLYSQIVKERKDVGGSAIASNVTKWSTGETVNYPKETYVWNRINSYPSFDFTSSTYTDWRKISTVTKTDSYGNVIEARDDVNDTYSAKIMGYGNSLPIGIVSNSTRAESFVDVFEDENLSKWVGSENGDGDTQWYVEDEQLKLINYASATSGECDRVYLNLGAEVTSDIVYEFDVKIANSDNWDLTIGLGGNSWTTGNGGTENAVWTAINNEEWKYYSGTWITIKSGLVVGKTYHFKIVAKPSTNKSDFYVNGVKYISDGNFRYSSSGIQKAAFGNYGYGTVTTTWYIDNVRLYPAGADIVSYNYNPLIGKTSETDVNGNAVIYEFDKYNRLETVRDGYGKILKHTNYSIRGNDAAAYLNTTPSVIDLPAGEGENGFSVSSNVDWVASVTGGWLSLTSSNSGSGNGSVDFDYSQNTTGSTRSAEITLQGEGLTKPVYIDQAPSTGSISANLSSLYFWAGSMSRTFTIFSDTNWTISNIYLDGSGWLSVSPSSGNGDAVIHVTCTAPYNGQTWSAQLKAQTTGGAYVIINVTFDDSDW